METQQVVVKPEGESNHRPQFDIDRGKYTHELRGSELKLHFRNENDCFPVSLFICRLTPGSTFPRFCGKEYYSTSQFDIYAFQI